MDRSFYKNVERNTSPKPALKQSTFIAAGAELSRTNNMKNNKTVQYKPYTEIAVKD